MDDKGLIERDSHLPIPAPAPASQSEAVLPTTTTQGDDHVVQTIPILMDATLVEGLGLELPELSASASAFSSSTGFPMSTTSLMSTSNVLTEFDSTAVDGVILPLAFTEKVECYNAQQLAWKIVLA
jgi:hypothetical protein